jgi:hypothetical protein
MLCTKLSCMKEHYRRRSREYHNAVSLFQMTKVEEKTALGVQVSRGMALLFL